MRKLVIVLAATTASFAATTLYFAHELQLAREQAAATITVSSPAPAPALAAVPQRASPGNTITKSIVAQEFKNAAGEAVDFRERWRQETAARAKESLSQLQDPAKRQQLVDEVKKGFRISNPRLDKYLELGDEEYERLLDLLAEHQLAQQEMTMSCSIDPSCPFPGVDHSVADSQEIEIAALIGSEKMDRYKTFRDSSPERSSIAQLRGRLPDKDPLSEEQANRLVSALADERKRIEAEMREQNSGIITGYNSNGVTFFATAEAADLENQLAEAREYNRRIRNRAAQVLTRSQLVVFDEMQEQARGTSNGIIERDGMAAVSSAR